LWFNIRAIEWRLRELAAKWARTTFSRTKTSNHSGLFHNLQRKELTHINGLVITVYRCLAPSWMEGEESTGTTRKSPRNLQVQLKQITEDANKAKQNLRSQEEKKEKGKKKRHF
jgi:hypothetical protein